MKVHVKYYAMVRNATGKKEETIELDNGSKVRDLLNIIVNRYGEALRRYLYSGEAQRIDYLMITVNDVNTMSLNKHDTILHDGDTVMLLPPIGGG
jgi:molybdopterin synthase sulfur carrier subunit